VTTPIEAASTYTDFQGLGALRRDARAKSPEALRTVARQFEAMFLNMILKGMRDGKLAEDVLGGEGESMYQDLHDQQLALHLSQQNSVGIADMLVRQLEKTLPPDGEPRSTGEPMPLRGRIAATGAYAPAPAPRELRLDLRT
jgi:flagellar protein FlgJ